VESSNSTRKSQEKMIEVLFEHFNFPKLVLWKQPACSLISTGASEGIIFECGAGISTCSPISNGLCVKEATIHSLLSGNYLTNFLQRELNDRHRRSFNDFFFYDNIKRQ